MATPGINPIALLNPQLASQQAAIAQQQALAQQLLQDGSNQQDPAQLANPGGFVVPVNPLLALGKALEKGYGGYMQGQALAKTRDMNSRLAASLQASNPATNPQDGSQLPWQGGMTPDNQQSANQNLAQALATRPQQQTGQPTMQTALNDPQYIRDSMAVGPEKAYDGFLARTSLTPEQKNYAAMGLSNSQWLANTQAAAQKAAESEHRPGSYSTNALNGQSQFFPQVPAGGQPVMQNGQAVGLTTLPILPPGANQPAPNQPPAAATQPGTVPPSAPVTGADLPPTQGPASAMMQSLVKTESGGNPNVVSPAGATGPAQVLPATAANPGYGVPPAKDNSPQENMRVGQDYLNAMTKKYNGDTTLGKMAYNWGPENVDTWIKNGSNPAHIPQDTKDYVFKVNGGPAQASPLPADFPKPAAPAQMTLAAGETEGAKTTANAVAQRNNDIMQQANSSPTRISDLQKIMDLAANSGTKFGPGADKASYYKAAAQQIPGIRYDPDDPNNDAANYEVAKKYFVNLGQQYQKALGGTGTDLQATMSQSGTPGPDMLNGAILKVAPYLIGQERALQAQANLRRAVTNPANGYTNPTQDLQNLEGYWQKNYDPDVFEYASMPQSAQKSFAASLPKDRLNALIPSYQKAMEAGWLK